MLDVVAFTAVVTVVVASIVIAVIAVITLTGLPLQIVVVVATKAKMTKRLVGNRTGTPRIRFSDTTPYPQYLHPFWGYTLYTSDGKCLGYRIPRAGQMRQLTWLSPSRGKWGGASGENGNGFPVLVAIALREQGLHITWRVCVRSRGVVGWRLARTWVWLDGVYLYLWRALVSIVGLQKTHLGRRTSRFMRWWLEPWKMSKSFLWLCLA